jgi:hypothetical protein
MSGVIPFDRDAREFPEGVAVGRVGSVVVSLDELGQVVEVHA